MGSTWSAPRLIGSELLACADNVTRDGTVDATELVLFATRCFVPSGVDVSVTQPDGVPCDRVQGAPPFAR
eukprot:2156105-Prymnesium_polylepis.1